MILRCDYRYKYKFMNDQTQKKEQNNLDGWLSLFEVDINNHLIKPKQLFVWHDKEDFDYDIEAIRDFLRKHKATLFGTLIYAEKNKEGQIVRKQLNFNRDEKSNQTDRNGRHLRTNKNFGIKDEMKVKVEFLKSSTRNPRMKKYTKY